MITYQKQPDDVMIGGLDSFILPKQPATDSKGGGLYSSVGSTTIVDYAPPSGDLPSREGGTTYTSPVSSIGLPDIVDYGDKSTGIIKGKKTPPSYPGGILSADNKPPVNIPVDSGVETWTVPLTPGPANQTPVGVSPVTETPYLAPTTPTLTPDSRLADLFSATFGAPGLPTYGGEGSDNQVLLYPVNYPAETTETESKSKFSPLLFIIIAAVALIGWWLYKRYAG